VRAIGREKGEKKNVTTFETFWKWKKKVFSHINALLPVEDRPEGITGRSEGDHISGKMVKLGGRKTPGEQKEEN